MSLPRIHATCLRIAGLALSIVLLCAACVLQRHGEPVSLEKRSTVEVTGSADRASGGHLDGSPDADWAARVARRLEAKEYEISEGGRGLQAPNRRHRLRTYFEPTGIRVADRTDPTNRSLLALELRRVGRPAELVEIGPGVVSHDRSRVEIARDGGVVEWYENSSAGLEQGFTLDARPAGAGPLVLELAVEHAQVQVSKDAVRFASDAGRDLRFAKLVVEDADHARVPARFEPANDGFRIVVEDAAARYPLVIDPLLTESYDFEIESNQLHARLGRAVAPAGDVNGDGYQDVIVGAPAYDFGQTAEGAAFIFHGGPDGLGDVNPALADTVLESDQSGSNFGLSVSTAGDVNGDGYDDVIVGAYQYETPGGPTDEGAAWVFLGGPSGVADATPATAHAEFRSGQAGSTFGIEVSNAGDVNGDGYGDVMIGSHLYTDFFSQEGAVFVYHGSASGLSDGTPATADTRFFGRQAGAQLGFNIASAGDLDSDGHDDVVLAAALYQASFVQEGAAVVFYGSPTGLPDGSVASAPAIFLGAQANARLGSSVASAGDVDGDGYGDVIVGVYQYSTTIFDGGVVPVTGVALLAIGGPNGIPSLTTPTTAATILKSDQSGALFGWSVASAGDVNGDGYGDVVVGAHGYDAPENGEGAAFVFLGGPFGMASSDPRFAYAVVQSDQVDAQLGVQVASAGDTDGDGYPELLVGAHLFDGPQLDEGQAFVYRGGGEGIASGGSASMQARIEANQPGALLGVSVASAGDVNGDGFSDVIVGAPYFDAGGTGDGAAFVFLGSASGITDADPSISNAQLDSGQSNAQFGWSVASAGDVNGDGFGDVIVGAQAYDAGENDEGAAFVFLGSASGISDADPATAHAQLESDQASALFGISVASAGDVNGDGFGDVIVGAPEYDAGEEDEGAAFVFLGSASGISDGDPTTAHAQLESDFIPAYFGGSVASAGDVNGDGFGDLIVGASGYGDGGAAFVFLGTASGIVDADPATAHAQLVSDQFLGNFGSSVASAGDVNGDGFGDLIVGANGYDSGEEDEGAAFVFLGSASGIADANPATAHAQLESDQTDAIFGWRVASAGDVNGDGFGDVIVGAPEYDAGEEDEGAAFVFLGSASGIVDADPSSAHAQLESDQADANFGESVAPAGDVNGDGFGDVIVGAWNFANGEQSEGAAFIQLGGGPGARLVLPRQLRGDGSGLPVARWGDSGVPGAFEVEMTVTSPRGREWAKLEVEACASGSPFGDPGCARVESVDWEDLSTGTNGNVLRASISGLEPGGLYAWRARARFAPMSSTGLDTTSVVQSGPWRTLGGQTGPSIRVPEPGVALGLMVGGLFLVGNARAARRIRKRVYDHDRRLSLATES